MYANGILTSCRYNNIYPIVDMKFVKVDNEVIRSPEYDILDDSPILQKYRKGLRLDEQDISFEDNMTYILMRENIKKDTENHDTFIAKCDERILQTV